MRKGKRMLILAMAGIIGMSLLGGCSGKKVEDSGQDNTDEIQITTGLDKNVKGEVSVMVWSGDGEYYEDIGNPKSTAGKKLSDPTKIVAQNVAQLYAVAKKFNEVYPGIKINVWSKIGDPDQYNTQSWEQEMENFQAK